MQKAPNTVILREEFPMGSLRRAAVLRTAWNGSLEFVLWSSPVGPGSGFIKEEATAPKTKCNDRSVFRGNKHEKVLI